MQFNVEIRNKVEHITCDCIILDIFKNFKDFRITNIFNASNLSYIQSIMNNEKFDGSIGNNMIIYNIPNFSSRRVLFMGLGDKNKLNFSVYKKILKNIISILKIHNYLNVSYLISNIYGKLDIYWKIRQTIEIIQDITYKFNKFKSIRNDIINSLIINFYIDNYNDLQKSKNAIFHGIAISKGIKIAKDLGNMPPNVCNTLYLAKKSKYLETIYPEKIQTFIIDHHKMKELGMNSYLAVGQGSINKPIMSCIEFRGKNYINKKPIILIGKGLTFDSGGISIKPASNMDEMKYDMCGAAVVYGIMNVLSILDLPLYIIGILAGCENMVDSKSLRPGDIIKTMSGKTVEVLNTDAEGRLVLCDVLTYVKNFNPEIVIDIATLTGSCLSALGNRFSGLMSNCKVLVKKLKYSAEQVQDYVWQLPIYNDLKYLLKSNFADIANIGGKFGGALTAGYFLSLFAESYNWAHLDIAGTAWNSYENKGATGRPLLLLSQFLINYVEEKIKLEK